MTNPVMSIQQVKLARRYVWNGHTVREVSKKLSLPYNPVWNAVRGNTWQSIDEPPPVPDGHLVCGRQPNDNMVCSNCGSHSTRPLTLGLCSACYVYQWRHNKPRPVDLRHSSYIEIDHAALERLYYRYLNGESLSSLTDSVDCSEETLRRRFIDHGMRRRSKVGTRQQLTPDLVRQARHLAHVEGIAISEIARRSNVNYVTMYDAVNWVTWQSAGGHRPALSDKTQPCTRCGLQTDQSSGLCLYCQGETQ